MDKIACMIFRGGTSKGVYFLKDDLPKDERLRNKLLIRLMGSPDSRQIDGLGGGSTTTSKVAIVEKSKNSKYDLEYTFAQVEVEKDQICFPTCGNILMGVGAFGIETGLVKAQKDTTKIRILDVNTKMSIEQILQTPNAKINYNGDFKISGVPWSAAPIRSNFQAIVGAKTNKFYPTGNKIDLIEGVECSCVDVAMPCVIFRARDFDITAYENTKTLNNNKELLEKISALRIIAGEKMGFKNVTDLVYPKPILINSAKNKGTITARYFTPSKCHDAFAISGGLALLSSCLDKENITAEFVNIDRKESNALSVEHPCGFLDITIKKPKANWDGLSGDLIRTARLIMKGEVMIPKE